RVAPGDDFEDGSDVADFAGERPNPVKRGRKGNQTIARNAAVAAHHGGNAAERTGLADGASGIGAKRGNGKARRYHGGRAAPPAATRASIRSAWRRARSGVRAKYAFSSGFLASMRR